jgi:crossover junction endodeoxyribonuclease RuvC
MATFTPSDLTLLPVAVVRILGIDPGTQVVGYGCLELAAGGLPGSSGAASTPLAMRGSNVVRASAARGGAKLVATGVFRLGKRGDALTSRLLSLSEQFAALVSELRPTEVAVEEAFFGKSVQAALRIGEARGVVLAESARAGLAVHQYAPARIKRCVAGHGSARKDTVARMLSQMIAELSGAAGRSLPEDATDAVAVAWTRLEELRSPLAAASRRPRGDGMVGR